MYMCIYILAGERDPSMKMYLQEFMYLVFTHMSDERCRRRLRSLFFCVMPFQR